MVNRLMKFSLNIARNNSDEEKLHDYFSILVVIIFCILPHSFFAVYFAFADIISLAVINIFSVFIYISTFFLLKRGKINLIALIITFEVSAFAAIMFFCCGYESGFQWYPLVIMLPHFIFIDSTKLQKILISLFIYIEFIIFHVLGNNVIPVYSVPFMDFIRVANINIIFFALIIEATMISITKKAAASVYNKNIEKFKMEAYLDPLTQLSNRRYAMKFFAKLCSPDNVVYPKGNCVAIIDIDLFKIVNDTYGHDIGDLVLKQLSNLLRGSFRTNDLISRWGGEEFLVVLTDATIDESYEVLNNLRKKVEQLQLIHGDITIRYTVTIGVAPIIGRDYEKAISTADKKLYEGKNSGRNKVVK